MNKVALVGRLTKDIELRGDSEKFFAMFTVAVNRPFKNKNGEYDVDFISCKAWDKTAEFIEKWFHKGDPIGVTGRIETGSYENKNGDTVYTTDVVVDAAEFVGNKKDKGDDSDNYKKPERSKKSRYDDDDYEEEKPKKKRKPDPDDEDEEYERPKKKRKTEEDNDYDYPF